MPTGPLIVIVNYKTPDLTIDCLRSLQPQVAALPAAHVILVDNASGDDSVQRITREIQSSDWTSWITFIASPRNTGFSGGNNLALAELPRHPDVRHVLLLNSDTIAPPNVLKYCLEKMEADSSVGVMSCLLLNRDQTVQNAARKMPSPMRIAVQSLGLPWMVPRLFDWALVEDPGWDRRTQTRDVEWVGGAFMLIRREVLENLGGLDERFFFYGEDIEFCHRVRKNGWKIRYDPGAAIIHLGGASSDPTRMTASRRDAMTWQARYLLQRRCYGAAAEFFVRVVDIIAMGLRCVKLLITGRRKTDEYARRRDVLTTLLRWPTTVKGKG